MPKNKTYKTEGIVVESLPNATFRVRLQDGKEILAHLAGKLKIYRIKILPGDRVALELPTPNDLRGRITYRQK